MAAPETVHARQAALLLHGLPPADRQEVIAKLGAAEAARLRPLLAELVELGVPPSLGQQMQWPESHKAGKSESINGKAKTIATPRERAEQLSVEHVVERLQDCAAVTAAQLLRSADWPWKQQVLERMSELRRAEVQQHLRRERPQLAPAALAVLCELLCADTSQSSAQRLRPAAQPRSDSQNSNLGTLTGMFRRLVRWMQ